MGMLFNKRFNESYLKTKLPNGLEVVLFYKPGYKKSFFSIGTPYGSADYKQVDEDNNLLLYPKGIAHFLEHKMFEKEGQDVLETFSQLGANVNAFTSYTETLYYFSINDDPTEALNLLLDFTHELEIDEASVEKEKGIIIQELEMYKQMPESQQITKALESTFINHYLKDDIGGTSESVKTISKDQLYECFKNNYHPSKMVLVGVSGIEPDKLLKVIKENQNNKVCKNVKRVRRAKFEEPLKIKENKAYLKMDVNNNKLTKIYKLKPCDDELVNNRNEWLFKILFDYYFSSLNDDYQKWLDEEIINDNFNFEIDLGRDYGLIMFSGESKNPSKFFNLIDHTISSISDIDEKIIDGLKKRYFGREVNGLDGFENLAIGYMQDYFKGIDFFKALENVETITKQEVLTVLKQIDIKNNLEFIISKNEM